MKEKLEKLRLILLDEAGSRKIICLVGYCVLGTVALVMTVMNIVTHKGALTWSTGIFAALCLVNLILAAAGPETLKLSTVLFSGEIIVLFTFFLVSGNPEGFSAIWVCMLPTMGMFFFGRRRGFILSCIMLAILVFLLWTVPGQSLLMFEYTSSFRMRFPVLFTSFLVMAYFLESLRAAAYAEMSRLQKLYRELSAHDPLTGVLNRQGLFSLLKTDKRFREPESIGVIMFDIDHFKDFNDNYGHDVGDAVLRSFAELIGRELGAVVCRWGGEEFVSVYTNGSVSAEKVERLRRLISEAAFVPEHPELSVTASIGMCEESAVSASEVERLISRTDTLLYNAKNSGRNRLIRG